MSPYGLNRPSAYTIYAQLDFANEPPEDFSQYGLKTATVEAITPKPKRQRFLSIDEIMDMAPPEWLVKGLIPKGGVGLLVGQSQAYKSFLALHAALCLSTGIAPHPDHPVAESVETIFIAGEGAGGFKLRIKAWMNAHPNAKPAMRLQAFPSYLDKEAEAKALALAIRELAEHDGKRHRLLVVDTFSANFTGKENTDDVAGFIRHCQRIAQTCDVTVLVIHHLGKDGDKGARGHSSLTANTDFWMTLERPNMAKRVVKLKPGKLKDAPVDHELWFEAVSVPVADCGEFSDSLVLGATQRPKAEVTSTGSAVSDDTLDQIAFMLEQVADGDSVPAFIKSVMELGLSKMTVERRIDELVEERPGLRIEKVTGAQNNRRVFKLSPT
jgi:putative DNA primase/helicase